MIGKTKMAKHTPTIFISYSHKDSKAADDLRRELSKKGLDVWSDNKIKPGDNWAQEIEKALKKAEYYLFLVTPDSIASQWNNVEMGVALSRQSESYVIPVLLKDAKVPFQLSSLQYLDGRNVDASQLAETISKLIKDKESE